MRSRWSNAAIVGLILALLTVVVTGLLGGEPADRDRALELEQQLRCPVCQSVSITESMSDTAEAMRSEVAEQVAAGRSDQEILGYFRARYGDWVVLDPPMGGNTLLVWLIPLAVGLAGAAAVLLRPRRHRDPPNLTPDARQQVATEVNRVRAGRREEDEV